MDESKIKEIWEREYARRAAQRATRIPRKKPCTFQTRRSVTLADRLQQGSAAIVRYTKSTAAWVEAGMPVRSDEEVGRLLAICEACPAFSDGRCTLCLCKINRGNGWINKLRRATEKCPQGKW